MRTAFITIVAIALLGTVGRALTREKSLSAEPIVLGWISDYTGSFAKMGAAEAGRIAVDEINASGGINGRPLKLIEEDGGCNPKTALNAAQKLIAVDRVSIILGGHCSPESVTIAPLAEKNKVIMFASMTTSPLLTNAGEYVFRTSPVSTVQTHVEAKYMQKLGIRKLGILYEKTAYAEPIAKSMRDDFVGVGGKVVAYEGVEPNVNDFRTQLVRIKSSGAEAIYLSPQNADHSAQIIQQLRALGITLPVFGNDILGSKALINLVGKKAAEGIVFGAPEWDQQRSKAKAFAEAYRARYGTELPFGIWTAETYDKVKIMADAIGAVGFDNEKIKQYLYGVKDYEGASGTFSIDEHGDGVRVYTIKQIKSGEFVEVE